VNYKWAGAMEKYYQRQMAKSGYSGRCILGVLYSHLGPLSAYWEWTIAGIIISSVVLGYLAPFGAVVIFLLPALMTIFWRVPVYGSMLVLGGRRERWLSGMVCSVTLVLLLASVGLAICGFGRVLSLFMPSIRSNGEEFEYLVINASLFWLPLVVGPIAFSVDAATGGRHGAKVIIGIVLMYAGAFVFGHFFDQISDGLEGLTMAIGVLASWFVFCTALWLCCRKRCLAGQNRQ
jgi:hypothetical protein